MCFWVVRMVYIGRGLTAVDTNTSEYWAELVARVQIGDGDSVEELYTAVAKSSRGKLFRSVDPQNVDDHVHEIMVIVLEAIRAGEIRDPSCLMSFVKTVTHRRVSLHIRGAMLRRRRLVSIESAPDPAAPFNQSPEARVALREKVDGVRRVIASLPARDREILTRFYYREQDAEQICREMSLTANQFRLTKSRAIAKCGSLTHPRSGMRAVIKKKAARPSLVAHRAISDFTARNREDSGDLGEVRDDFGVAPEVVEHLANRLERGVAKFEDEAAAGFQESRGFGDEAAINRESVAAGVEREPGLMVANFRLQRRAVAFEDVGRIRHDHVEGAVLKGVA